MIGALIGHGLGDLSAFGVAMAFPAIFIFLTVAMWPKHDLKKEIAVIVSLLGAAFAAQIVPVVYCTAIGSIIGILVFCLLSLHKEKV